VPLILLAPLAVVAIIALGVRGRRSTANLAFLAPLAAGVGVALAGALLAALVAGGRLLGVRRR